MNGQHLTITLDFLSDDTGRIQCTEPLKFDASTFSVEQDKGRIGRDVTIGNEEISLQFWKGTFEQSNLPTELPDGTVYFFKTMCFERLADYNRRFGSEALVNFIVSNNGNEFIVGEIDFETAVTDDRNYFECKIIQQTQRAAIKMDEDTKIDLYSNKDVKGNPITPLVPVNLLLEPLPIYGVSSWKYGRSAPKNVVLTNGEALNFSNRQVKTELRSTLSFLGGKDGILKFPYIQASDELTNIKVKFSAIDVKHSGLTSGNFSLRVLVYTQPDSNVTPFPYVPDSPPIIVATISPTQEFDTNYEISIPLLLRGQRIGIYFKADGLVEVLYKSMDVEISATGTSIASVVKAVQYIKPYEQAVKSINGQTVAAPRFQGDGEFKNLYVLNGTGMRGFDNKPFYVTWKDLADNLVFANCDYQTTPDKVIIASRDDFYPDREIGRFLQIPDREIHYPLTNPRLTPVKLVTMAFQKYAKEDENSLTNIHTEAQFRNPNERGKNKIDIKIPFIFDDVLIEQTRRKSAIQDPTTATDNDDDIFAIQTEVLAPGARRNFTAFLEQRINGDGNLEILNNNIDQYNTTEAPFAWSTLGTAVETIVNIGMGDNAGAYTILTITPTVITLVGSPSFSGHQIINFDYLLVGVNLVKKTFQGYVQPNIGIPDGYGNLDFTIGRIARNYYGRQFAEMCQLHPDKSILIKYYKNLTAEENVITQQIGQEAITEYSDIVIADLPEPNLSPFVLSSRVVVTFEQALAVYKALDTLYSDGTVGGYVTVLDGYGNERKTYLTKSSYLWADGVMDVDGEVKRDSGYLLIEDGGYLRLEDGGRIIL